MATVIATIVSSVCEALSLTDLYKYVLNSMHCKSSCCKHFIDCELDTEKIDIPSDDDGDGTVKIIEACCGGLHDIYTEDESEDDIL